MWCLFSLKCHLGKAKEKLSKSRQCWLKHIFYLKIIYFQRRVFQLNICMLLRPVFWLYFHANTPMKGRCGFLCNPGWTSGRKVTVPALLPALAWGFQKGRENPFWADRSPYRPDRSVILIILPPPNYRIQVGSSDQFEMGDIVWDWYRRKYQRIM